MDPAQKEAERQKTMLREEAEKKQRVLELNSSLAPSRGRRQSNGVQAGYCQEYAYNPEKTVVSRPIKLTALRNGGWYFLEERFLVEYDRIRETSLKLLFGPAEKPTRIGRGLMEESVFTVAPFKDNRVKLSKLVNAPSNRDISFYNASWIGREFIAAAMPQGPVFREQFWRMIWEYDVPTVVMLNDDGEGKHRHPEITRYWPIELNRWESYGQMQVMKTEQVIARNMSSTVRKILLRQENNPEMVKSVVHLQYRDWPDGGIPADRDDYKEFIFYLLNLARVLREHAPVPVVVHW